MSARARAMASRAREVEADPGGGCGRRGGGFWRVVLIASGIAAGAGLVIHLLSPVRVDGATPERESDPGSPGIPARQVAAAAEATVATADAAAVV